MIDRIKYYAKLSATGFFSFIKYFSLGNISAAFSFAIGLIILLMQIQLQAPHVSGSAFMVMIFTLAPVQSILLLLIIISGYFIFSLASGYAVKKVICKIIHDNAEGTLYPLIDKVTGRVQSGITTSRIGKGIDSSVLKLQLIHTVKEQSENRWIKKTLTYAFRKMKIDDINFDNDNINLCDIIKQKTINSLNNASTPGKQKLWLIVGFHWLSVLIIMLLG